MADDVSADLADAPFLAAAPLLAAAPFLAAAPSSQRITKTPSARVGGRSGGSEGEDRRPAATRAASWLLTRDRRTRKRYSTLRRRRAGADWNHDVDVVGMMVMPCKHQIFL